jgi:hypothetical protein
MSQYPNSGKLSPNRYKDDPKKPDMVGDIIMMRADLKALLQEHSDDEVVIKLSGWNRQGNFGEFISLRWNNFKKKEEPSKPRQEKLDDSDIPF